MKNSLLLLAILISMLIAHTMEFSMHELTKKQEGTFYTISASFVGDTSKREYTYKVPEDAFCKVGDLAVVETNTGYKLTEVKKVHEIPAIDYTKPYEYRWVACIADISWWNSQKAVEKQWRKDNTNTPKVNRL